MFSLPLLCSRLYSRVLLLRCRYGAHLTKGQVAELVAPHPETLELVNAWLKHYGVQPSSISTTHGGGWLTVTGVPVSRANDLLGASYLLYRHVETNDTILRTVRYALPEALHTHVRTVAPTTYFASTRTQQQLPRSHSGEVESENPIEVLPRARGVLPVTPAFLRSLYGTTEITPAATGMNMIGVTGYLGQYPSPLDLSIFMDHYRTDGIDAEFTVEEVNGGGYDPGNPGAEANLNIQITQGIAYPVPQIFYSTGGTPPNIPSSNSPTADRSEPYLDWLKYMLDQDNVPPTITTSYGVDEQTVPEDYAREVCNLFAILGDRGVSLLFASGNGGVGDGDCMANDGSGKVRFLPLFPASCMCGVLSLLANSEKSQVLAAHQTSTLSQVPG
jgi:tripeptidyl-peptidase-1